MNIPDRPPIGLEQIEPAHQKIEQPVQRAMPTPGGGTQVDPKTGKPIGATLKPQPQMEAAIERLAEAFAQWKKDKAA